MTIHRRHLLCQKAESSLECLILEQVHLSRLTEPEAAEIVINVLSSFLRRRFQLLTRLDRHGNTKTPGGLE